jgi:hypothetical protein
MRRNVDEELRKSITSGQEDSDELLPDRINGGDKTITQDLLWWIRS